MMTSRGQYDRCSDKTKPFGWSDYGETVKFANRKNS